MTATATAGRTTSAGGTSNFTGTGHMLGFVLRRDRVRLAIWVTVLGGLMAASAASVLSLYDTPEALRTYAELARDNTAIIVQAGPGHGLDDPTTAAVLMNESGIWMAIAVAIMSLFMVTRHTRHEEDSGRAELMRAAPVGRYSPAAATMMAVLIANLAVALTMFIVLVALALPVAGALAFAASLVGIGMVFAGLSLVAGQIASSARSANGLAMALVGLAFLLRAVGDVRAGWLSWLSPIGWAQAIRAFADERWWVLLLPATATVLLVVLADVLTSHRDLGGGLVPQRLGRPEAPPSLSGTFGLALRLHRGSLIGWAAGLAVLGFFMGIVATEAETLIGDNPEFSDFFVQFGEQSLVDAFLATSVMLLALAGSGFTVSAVLRLRGEESEGRTDALLTTPLDRRRWMASHLTVAALGTLAIMAVGGLATGLGYGIASGDLGVAPPLLAAGVALVPAMLTLGGITAALFGVLPRWSLVGWGALTVALVMTLFGEMLRLPDPVLDVSPFAHAPTLPGGTVEVLPLAALMVVTAALAAVGVAGIQRRDMS